MKKITVVIFALLLSSQSHANQYIDASDGSPKVVAISSQEFTRVAIEGSKVLKVKHTIGEIEYDKDDVNGEVYIKPIVKKNIYAFVISESGKNYALTLKPSDMLPDSIIIREGQVREAQQNQAAQYAREQRRAIARNSEAYMSAVKKFIYGMATGDLGDDISKSISGEQVPLWNEALLIRTARFTTADLYGQSFTLNNTSAEVMVIEEQEFYKKGVIAVAIRQLQLQPGEQTEVFVVSTGVNQ